MNGCVGRLSVAISRSDNVSLSEPSQSHILKRDPENPLRVLLLSMFLFFLYNLKPTHTYHFILVPDRPDFVSFTWIVSLNA